MIFGFVWIPIVILNDNYLCTEYCTALRTDVSYVGQYHSLHYRQFTVQDY
jgi:hypothetical protein